MHRRDLHKIQTFIFIQRLYAYLLILKYLELLSKTSANKTSQTTPHDEAYTYDNTGNRLTSLPDRIYTYNTGNQLINFKNKLYTYDKNGNLISKTEEDYDEDIEIEGWFYEKRKEKRGQVLKYK